MSQEHLASLFGVFNPSGTSPSFVVPVFTREDVLCVAHGRSGIIDGFTAYDFDMSQVLKLSDLALNPAAHLIDPAHDRLAAIGAPMPYAFQFTDNSVLVGTEVELKRRLFADLESLRQFAFVFVEVCEFLGLAGETQRAYEAARDVLAQSDAEIARRWFTDNTAKASERSDLAATSITINIPTKGAGKSALLGHAVSGQRTIRSLFLTYSSHGSSRLTATAADAAGNVFRLPENASRFLAEEIMSKVVDSIREDWPSIGLNVLDEWIVADPQFTSLVDFDALPVGTKGHQVSTQESGFNWLNLSYVLSEKKRFHVTAGDVQGNVVILVDNAPVDLWEAVAVKVGAALHHQLSEVRFVVTGKHIAQGFGVTTLFGSRGGSAKPKGARPGPRKRRRT